MKLLLAGNGLLLAGTIADWHDLALTRWNQAYRTDTGDAVRYVADQIYNGSNSGSASGRWSGLSSLDFRVERELTRQERNELARDLRINAPLSRSSFAISVSTSRKISLRHQV